MSKHLPDRDDKIVPKHVSKSDGQVWMVEDSAEGCFNVVTVLENLVSPVCDVLGAPQMTKMTSNRMLVEYR